LSATRRELIDDLPLFAASFPAARSETEPSAVENRLREIIPDDLSPRQALELIFELTKLAACK
jgi:DNA mismatch repair protein MutS